MNPPPLSAVYKTAERGGKELGFIVPGLKAGAILIFFT